MEDPRHPAHGTRAVGCASAVGAAADTVTWPFARPALLAGVHRERHRAVVEPHRDGERARVRRAHEARTGSAADPPSPRVRSPARNPDDAAVLVVLAVIADHVHDQPVEARLRRGVAGVLEPADAPPADVQRAVAVEVAERHDVAAAIVEAGGGVLDEDAAARVEQDAGRRAGPRGQDHVLEIHSPFRRFAGRGGDGRLRVAADAVPRHHAIGADGDVGLDLDAELGAADAEVRGRQRAAGARGDRQRQAADGAVGEERRHEDVGVDRVRVGERQLPGEERVRRTLGQPSREAAERMGAGEELGAVAGAVAVGIVGRAVGRRRRLRIEAEGDLPGVRQGVPVRVDHPWRDRRRTSRGEQDDRGEDKDERGATKENPICAIDTFCSGLHSAVATFCGWAWKLIPGFGPAPPPGLPREPAGSTGYAQPP